MSPIPPNVNFELGNLNLKNNSVDPSTHLKAEGKVVNQFIKRASAVVAFHIDEKQEKLEFILSQANPELVKELLLFMLRKEWLLPSADIYSFLKNGYGVNNPRKEIICDWPNIENSGTGIEQKSILNTKDKFLLSINATIENHLDDESFRPNCLAKKIFLCGMQLHRKLKKLAGLSPSNYIRKYRLQRSLDYLRQDQWSVSEVCYKVGFRSLEYFSRSFKKEFGECPSEYKSRC